MPEDIKTFEENVRGVCEELRAALQADGGDMAVVKIDGKTVYVVLQGACGCCPHAMMTLKGGVERVLRERVDPDIVVERVE
ncbi:MAG: NifU family protein [Lentisphaeria bacterium]|nr:NifU family protein [Lentisphaeria bacterium]